MGDDEDEPTGWSQFNLTPMRLSGLARCWPRLPTGLAISQSSQRKVPERVAGSLPTLAAEIADRAGCMKRLDAPQLG